MLLKSDLDLHSILLVPPQLTIYRAMCIKEAITEEYGISWTLDRSVAEFFAIKFPAILCMKHGLRKDDRRIVKKGIVKRTVDKSHILAYFSGRGEEEVIYISK